ncbi:nitroreductase family protein [Azohydromonas aeria]|uniref:nitroreductase family protein n=1 Tax=Azohydromonas aeria TaxID=2590212 RepID=UPI0012FAB952|nr:nitroreductase family protein [Azohydromonas aeria]
MSLQRKSEYPVDPMFTCRWSPRAFNAESIEPATLMTLFEAARWAPSSFNAQPWRFIYGRRDTPAWQPLHDALNDYNRSWAHRASVLVAVLSSTTWTPPGKLQAQPLGSHSFDTGAAWASLAFQATLLGWHAHAMGGFDRERLRQALDIPEDHAIEAMVAIGWRSDQDVLPEALQAREVMTQRLPLDQLVAEGSFTFNGRHRNVDPAPSLTGAERVAS